MSDSYFSIVPKIKTYPGNKERAAGVVKWLAGRNIIEPVLSACILSVSQQGYAIAAGAKAVVKEPGYLPFDLTVNGLEVITEMTVFDPGEFLDEEEVDTLMESDLGFTFWNWPEPTEKFMEEIKEQLGCDVEVVRGRI